MTNAELAKAVGVSTRTARRYRSRLTAASNGHPTDSPGPQHSPG